MISEIIITSLSFFDRFRKESRVDIAAALVFMLLAIMGIAGVVVVSPFLIVVIAVALVFAAIGVFAARGFFVLVELLLGDRS